ncbi:hypothetical protein [Amycolatopsis sp. lyj-23]|uniref:hypothetical protein n=1 Tax=Amycolatopsis sp. lyj-23 TaxID=2789283 RepID=UPI003979E7E2
MPPSENRPSPEELVATYWPHQRPYDRDGLADALSTAAELFGVASHATDVGPVAAHPRIVATVPQVTDVQEAAYHLARVARQLAPLARKLADRLTTLTAEDPTLYTDSPEEAGAHTTAAAADLARAVAAAEELARDFTGAFQTLGHVNHRRLQDPE